MKKFLKTRFLPLLGVLVLLISAVVVPVSAAEYAVDNTIVAYDPILDNYPTSNMLPFPYRFRGTTYNQGLTVTVNDDTSITFDGIPTTTLYNVVARINLPVGDYVLSGIPLGSTKEIWATVRTPQGNFYKSGDCISFSVQSSNDLIEILISVYSGYVVDMQTFYLMLSKGSISLPWSPYLPYQLNAQFEQGRNDGYDEGYGVGVADGFEQGRNEGYDEGYDVGVADGKQEYTEIAENNGKVNFFLMPNLRCRVTAFWLMTVDGAFLYENDDVDFVYSNGSITFPTLYDEMLAASNSQFCDGAYLTQMTIDFLFDRDNNIYGIDFFPVAENTGLEISSDATGFHLDIFSCEFPRSDNPIPIYRGSVNAYGVGYFQESELGQPITNMGTMLKNTTSEYVPSWIKGLTYKTACYGYSDIYKDGYLVGYDQGGKDALDSDGEILFNAGVRQGYEEGYLTGKKEGLTLSENGSWRELMTSVVEAPVNTFTSLFNFEILGLDMRLAFGSILAICVLLIVVKKVIL